MGFHVLPKIKTRVQLNLVAVVLCLFLMKATGVKSKSAQYCSNLYGSFPAVSRYNLVDKCSTQLEKFDII